MEVFKHTMSANNLKRRPVPAFTEEQRAEMDAKHAQGEFLDRKELRDVVQGIMNTIKNEELKAREKHPWLQYQDTLGFLFFASRYVI